MQSESLVGEGLAQYHRNTQSRARKEKRREEQVELLHQMFLEWLKCTLKKASREMKRFELFLLIQISQKLTRISRSSLKSV